MLFWSEFCRTKSLFQCRRDWETNTYKKIGEKDEEESVGGSMPLLRNLMHSCCATIHALPPTLKGSMRPIACEHLTPKLTKHNK